MGSTSWTAALYAPSTQIIWNPQGIRNTVREKIEKTREDLAKLEQKMEILEAIK